MDTLDLSPTDGGRKRRIHSREFKAQAVAACQAPGVSLSATALMLGVNANLLRRWLIADVQASGVSTGRLMSSSSNLPTQQDAFVAVPVPKPVSTGDIRIEVQRGRDAIKVSWPTSDASECAAFLRDWLK